MKIVQFSNGKYGVRTYWFFGWVWIGDGDMLVRFDRATRFNTIEDARLWATRSKEPAYKILEDI